MIAAVLAHYFDHGPRDVRRIVTQASLNTNFLVDEYVLKCRRGTDANRAIARECTLLARLTARGVRVPALVTTRSGAPSVDAHGAAWMLTARAPGEHFVGHGPQLEAVAAELLSLVRALSGLTLEDDSPATPGQFLRDLPDLLRSVETGQVSPLRARVHEHIGAILDAMEAVLSAREAIETPCGLVHVDVHPMNVLLDDAHVACLLDMEDVVTYPILAAVGFGGYKLIRRALSEPAIDPAQGRALAARWAAAVEMDLERLGMGARYRELALVTYILREHTEHGSFVDGVEAGKHLRAFTELDWLFPRDKGSQ